MWQINIILYGDTVDVKLERTRSHAISRYSSYFQAYNGPFEIVLEACESIRRLYYRTKPAIIPTTHNYCKIKGQI